MHIIEVRIMWVSNYMYKKVVVGYLQSDIHVIARRLREKKARGEPITIENFVIDTIIIKIAIIITIIIAVVPPN